MRFKNSINTSCYFNYYDERVVGYYELIVVKNNFVWAIYALFDVKPRRAQVHVWKWQLSASCDVHGEFGQGDAFSNQGSRKVTLLKTKSDLLDNNIEVFVTGNVIIIPRWLMYFSTSAVLSERQKLRAVYTV